LRREDCLIRDLFERGLKAFDEVRGALTTVERGASRAGSPVL